MPSQQRLKLEMQTWNRRYSKPLPMWQRFCSQQEQDRFAWEADQVEMRYLRTVAFTDDQLNRYQQRIVGIERRLWRYLTGYRHGMPYSGRHAAPPWPKSNAIKSGMS